jgi:AraC family transcriptional regulator, regulatory protein of adaptative response / DNA-3-methyladenine glycosylase II
MSEGGQTLRLPRSILDLVHDDFEACWRASASRDRRFDGRFFIGVHSTRIYCRPICPAPPAKRENVRFYPTAAAAEAAGLRACRRCRPETAPGTPEWLGGSATVARGLRLIADGYLDRQTVPELARELCVGERQLRRLFVEHLGASPHLVARQRRLQLARMLIDQTSLPMIDVASASGFSSLRRFNASVRSAFGRSPSELRRSARPRPNGVVALRLPYRPPLAWESLLGFLADRAVPGVEEARHDTYRRTIRTEAGAALVEVTPIEGTAELAVRLELPSVDALRGLVTGVRAAFDLDADPLAIHGSLDGLAGATPGLRVPGTLDPFELAARAVLGQQVSVRAARTLAGRLVERFGESLPEPSGALTHLFPAPGVLVDAPIEAIGLPGARAETIRRLARAVAVEGLDLAPTSSPDDVRNQLGAIPGIGPWTVEYVAMRAMRDPDAFPAGDLGLRHALAANGRPASATEVEERSTAWRPWRAYAAVQLWESLAAPSRVAA